MIRDWLDYKKRVFQTKMESDLNACLQWIVEDCSHRINVPLTFTRVQVL